MMNMVNASTGFSPFQLRMGHSPCLIPPLVRDWTNDLEDTCTANIIEQLASDTMEAQDNLLYTKTDQAISANLHRADNFPFQVGGRVMLSTLHQHEYKSKGQHQVAKFMPHYDGPYTIIEVHAARSTVTLNMPNSPNVFPVFHTSQVKPFKPNDPLLFPSRELKCPQPVIIDGHKAISFTTSPLPPEGRLVMLQSFKLHTRQPLRTPLQQLPTLQTRLLWSATHPNQPSHSRQLQPGRCGGSAGRSIRCGMLEGLACLMTLNCLLCHRH